MNGGGGSGDEEFGVEQEETEGTEEVKTPLTGLGHGFQAGLVSLGVGGGSESEDSDPFGGSRRQLCRLDTSVDVSGAQAGRGWMLQWGRCDRRTSVC